MYGSGGPQYGRSESGGTARLVYQGVRYTIPPGGLRVGRDGSNGLVIADASVSRQHVVLWTTDQGIFARDLGSHNGTFVNGYRLGAEPVLVRNGDRIQAGPAELVVEVEAARQAYAPPPADQPTYPRTPAAGPAYGGAAPGYGSAAPSYPSRSSSGSGSSRTAPVIAFATLLIGGALIYAFLSGKVGSSGSPTPTPTAIVAAATTIATATPAGAPTPGLGLLGLATPTATRAATATAAPPTPSPTIPSAVATGRNPGVDRALKGAVLQVIIPIPNTQEAELGSGSLLTRSGYILTNAHVVLDDAKRNLLNNGEGIVAIPPTEGGVAKPRYRAKVVDILRDQDLALLKITSEMDRSPVRGPLPIEPLDVGSSESVRIDDPLVIVGYPGLGGDSITVTRGIVSGIDQQRGFWKTDSEVSPGNSGGAALNQKGELIGVPTAGIVSQETVSKISLVRPIQFAKPLIDKARADP